MNLRYLLLDVDGIGSFGVQSQSEIRALLGPQAARVRLIPQLFMAGFVNDVGMDGPTVYPRNVVGSVLLAALGGSQQPYFGPVVLTGSDPLATSRSLLDIQVQSLTLLSTDIRKILGLEPGVPSLRALPFVRDVLDFAEYVRTFSSPTATFLRDADEAEQVAQAFLSGRTGGRS